jgi:Tfp pilus assembly protein PilE
MNGQRLPRRVRGFTLVEIATAGVVLVVLTAIAIPVFTTWSMQDDRAEAHRALNAVLAAQEEFIAQHARYATAAEISAPKPKGAGVPLATTNYLLTLQMDPATLSWVATARAAPGRKAEDDDRCAVMRLDHNGTRTALGKDGEDHSEDCWK